MVRDVDDGPSSIREIGLRIAAAAKLKKIKTSHLDIATGQSKGQTSRLVHGKRVRSINPEVIPRYAKALGVSLRWLYEGVGNMDDPDTVTTTLEADLRRSTEPSDADNIEVAARYHRNVFAAEVVQQVRERAVADGVDIGARHPDKWAIVLAREQRKYEAEVKRSAETARKLLAAPAKKRAS